MTINIAPKALLGNFLSLFPTSMYSSLLELERTAEEEGEEEEKEDQRDTLHTVREADAMMGGEGSRRRGEREGGEEGEEEEEDAVEDRIERKNGDSSESRSLLLEWLARSKQFRDVTASGFAAASTAVAVVAAAAVAIARCRSHVAVLAGIAKLLHRWRIGIVCVEAYFVEESLREEGRTIGRKHARTIYRQRTNLGKKRGPRWVDHKRGWEMGGESFHPLLATWCQVRGHRPDTCKRHGSCVSGTSKYRNASSALAFYFFPLHGSFPNCFETELKVVVKEEEEEEEEEEEKNKRRKGEENRDDEKSTKVDSNVCNYAVVVEWGRIESTYDDDDDDDENEETDDDDDDDDDDDEDDDDR
ncbi:LOW QUALITY PROTEIN: hypothetical protein V1478_011827 [Vespula squamosa]|uniref:Uncharacterized protein n=1 Tax=Vespula squamosa TaxID=30214 RepID=A0ABD2AC10_VESSQ